MSKPIEGQLRDYFSMLDRMQDAVDVDAVVSAPARPELRLVETNTEQENLMLAPNKNERSGRSRSLLLVAAAVAALALIGGLIFVGNRGDEAPIPADRPEPSVVDPVVDDSLDGEPAPDSDADVPTAEWVVEVDPALLVPQFVMSSRFTQSDEVVSPPEVERGDDVLGCSTLSYVNAGAGVTTDRTFTCESGERVGTFTVRFRPQGYANADFLSGWAVVGATGDFVGLQGDGVFFVDIDDADNEAGENFVGQIDYVAPGTNG